MSAEDIERIKRKGAILVKNVVNDSEAIQWREDLKTYVSSNTVEGIPENDKQFFQL